MNRSVEAIGLEAKLSQKTLSLTKHHTYFASIAPPGEFAYVQLLPVSCCISAIYSSEGTTIYAKTIGQIVQELCRLLVQFYSPHFEWGSLASLA